MHFPGNVLHALASQTHQYATLDRTRAADQRSPRHYRLGGVCLKDASRGLSHRLADNQEQRQAIEPAQAMRAMERTIKRVQQQGIQQQAL